MAAVPVPAFWIGTCGQLGPLCYTLMSKNIFEKSTAQLVILCRVDTDIWMFGHFLGILRLWAVPPLLLLDTAQLARTRLVISQHRSVHPHPTWPASQVQAGRLPTQASSSHPHPTCPAGQVMGRHLNPYSFPGLDMFSLPKGELRPTWLSPVICAWAHSSSEASAELLHILFDRRGEGFSYRYCAEREAVLPATPQTE